MRCVLALFAMGFACTAEARTPAGSIDEFIAAEISSSGAPGIAYAVVDNGVVTSGAAGETLIGSGKPVTPDTPFLIGSISKSFTAMGLMKLVEAGKVALDAPVSRYLDVFRDRPSGAITIRQLLSHTSGFSTLQGNDTHVDRTPARDELQRQVKRLGQQSPAYAPNAQWQYSNANYLILGAIIERMSGQDFASYTNTEILEPIGMDKSFVSDGRADNAMAVGHQPWFGTKRPLSSVGTSRAGAPAGGVVSTASDLALYLRIMMNGKDDIISAASKAVMLRPASAASPSYGLGWSLDRDNGVAYHSGLTPGVETLAVMSPAKNRGVVILVNANGGIGFGEIANLFDGVTERVLGIEENNDDGRWGRISLFLTFALLPLIFLAGIITAWFRRRGLRAKSGAFGVFSLWFPLVMMLGLAWTSVGLIPQLFGVPLSTFALYQPDFVTLLIATAVTGVAWAMFRLGLFYTGKAARSGPPAS
jgi:CubicO group peptidase (beta-lactamase class C family)